MIRAYLEETFPGGGGSFQLNETDSFVNLKRGMISLWQDKKGKNGTKSDRIHGSITDE
jgi:hypothetical protein